MKARKQWDVGCVPPASGPHPADVSTSGERVLKWTSLNRSPVLATRCHHSKGGAGGSCTVRSRGQRGDQSWEVPAQWGPIPYGQWSHGTSPSPMDRQARQLFWQAVMIHIVDQKAATLAEVLLYCPNSTCIPLFASGTFWHVGFSCSMGTKTARLCFKSLLYCGLQGYLDTVRHYLITGTRTLCHWFAGISKC